MLIPITTARSRRRLDNAGSSARRRASGFREPRPSDLGRGYGCGPARRDHSRLAHRRLKGEGDRPDRIRSFAGWVRVAGDVLGLRTADRLHARGLEIAERRWLRSLS